MPNTYSIIIVGGGMVGLSAACALAKLGLSIAVIDNHPPLQPNYTQPDARVSSINLENQRFLQQLNVWQCISSQARCPLRDMQVWDHLGGGQIHFDAADIGVAELGCIVENRALRYALWQCLQALDGVDLITASVIDAAINEQQAVVKLDNQKTLSADLLIAADGGRSPLRDTLQMSVQQRTYQQQAIIAVVQAEQAHRMTAYQNFLPTGPVAVLPLADAHRMNLIWSVDTVEAERLMALEQTSFQFELANALQDKLGKLSLLTERKAIPLIMRHAKQYVKERIALLGDAAHTIHPLAGQGVNLGFADAACLAREIDEGLQKKRDIGSLRVLRQYERARRGDNASILLAMRVFKELFASQAMPVVQARSAGFNTVNRITLLKKLFMDKAVGTHGVLTFP